MEIAPAGISVGGISVGGIVDVGTIVAVGVFTWVGSGVAFDGNIPLSAVQAIRNMETIEIRKARS
jgi:hypothetical protein